MPLIWGCASTFKQFWTCVLRATAIDCFAFLESGQSLLDCLAEVVGGLICLGVSVTFMSIFGTAGCLAFSWLQWRTKDRLYWLCDFCCVKQSMPQGVWCYAVCLHDRWRMEAAAVLVVYFLMSWVVHFVGCIIRIPVSRSKPCKHECTWLLRCCIARKEHGLPPNPNIPENFGSSWIKSLQIFQCRFASHTLPDFLRNLQVLIDADAAS